MQHLKMDFANEAELSLEMTSEMSAGPAYSLECLNLSPVPMYFYMYQQMPGQTANFFSLAWLASPIKIATGAKITFRWTMQYDFLWAATGLLQPGVTGDASQIKPCDPSGANQTSFSVTDNTPYISDPIQGGQPGNLTIQTAANVPNMTYATGIGMSGSGMFVQQAQPNFYQVYTPHFLFQIAAANQIQMGEVLSPDMTGSAGITFPPNIYKMYATLNADHTWNVSQAPSSV